MRQHLSGRNKWQNLSEVRGSSAQDIFGGILKTAMRDTNYEVIGQPKNLRDIYAKGHGIMPDFCITNNDTGRSVWVEIKRQKKEGNAHERVCRYFVPSIIEAAREIGNISPDQFPFWIIFTNGLANDKRRRREIKFWFKGIGDSALLLWPKLTSYETPLEHFDQYIAPILG